MPQLDANSIAYALDSAREDGKTLKQRLALLRQAVEFIGELAAHADAYGENLPRGYQVVKVRGRKDKNGDHASRIEVRHAPRGFFAPSKPLKIAVLKAKETELFATQNFERHLVDGLLSEIGDYFVERFLKNQRETQRLRDSLTEVENVKRFLARVEREMSGES